MLLNNSYFSYAGFIIFGIITFIVVCATVLPFFHFKQWYFRIFDYPRLQTFFMAIAAFAWYAIFYFRMGKPGLLILVLLFGVILVQAFKAFPYTPFAPKQVLQSEIQNPDSTAISLFICNVLQSNEQYEKVIEQINSCGADIVITTESNQRWQDGLKRIEKDYPNVVSIPQDNSYGMHLYSKLPLKNTEVRYLLEPNIPSIRTALQLRSGSWVHLFIVHPRPPFPTEDEDSKERDAEILLVAKEARKIEGGVIVAGDFNDVAWSETSELFQEVSGFLDPRRGRGFYNTFHAGYPVFRWPLDHIFHSSEFKLLKIQRMSKVGSDHFPMFVKLNYEPEGKNNQPEVAPDEETEERANEAIQEGKEDAKDNND